jgi:hypothetical protein
MKSGIEKVGVFWDFRYLPISDYERNAQMLIKYRDLPIELSKFAYASVENYDTYVGAIYDYFNALGLCRVIKDHVIQYIGVSDYDKEIDRVLALYSELREKRSSTVRQIRRTGIMKKAGTECNFCKSKDDLHSHHIIPLYLGGTDSFDNFITVCSNCHRLLHAQISCVVKHVQTVRV